MNMKYFLKLVSILLIVSLHIVSCNDKNLRRGNENQQKKEFMNDMPPYRVITKPAKIDVGLEFERPFSVNSCTVRIILHNSGDKPYYAFEENGAIVIDGVVGRFNASAEDHLKKGAVAEVKAWDSQLEAVAIPAGESKSWRIDLARKLPLKVGDNRVSMRFTVVRGVLGSEERGSEPVLIEGIYLEILELLKAF